MNIFEWLNERAKRRAQKQADKSKKDALKKRLAQIKKAAAERKKIADQQLKARKRQVRKYLRLKKWQRVKGSFDKLVPKKLQKTVLIFIAVLVVFIVALVIKFSVSDSSDADATTTQSGGDATSVVSQSTPYDGRAAQNRALLWEIPLLILLLILIRVSSKRGWPIMTKFAWRGLFLCIVLFFLLPILRSCGRNTGGGQKAKNELTGDQLGARQDSVTTAKLANDPAQSIPEEALKDTLYLPKGVSTKTWDIPKGEAWWFQASSKKFTVTINDTVLTKGTIRANSGQVVIQVVGGFQAAADIPFAYKKTKHP